MKVVVGPKGSFEQVLPTQHKEHNQEVDYEKHDEEKEIES